MWQVDLRSFCYSRALKSLAYIWQIPRPVWTGTGKYCLNPHLFFVSFRSPRTKMSSCLYLLRKTMRILDPRPEHDIWTLKSWRGPYDSVKHLVTNSYIHDLHVKTETQYSDSPDRSEDNLAAWPAEILRQMIQNTRLGVDLTLILCVALTLPNTFLPFTFNCTGERQECTELTSYKLQHKTL